MSNENQFPFDPRRSVKLHGFIDEALSRTLRDRIDHFLCENREPIGLIIDSSGGRVTPSLDLFYAIRRSPADIIGFVEGQAVSMASFILQACDERLAHPAARILLHNIERIVEIRFTTATSPEAAISVVHGEIAKTAELQAQIDRLYAQRMGVDVAAVRAVCDRAAVIPASEAVRLKLLDRILD